MDASNVQLVAYSPMNFSKTQILIQKESSDFPSTKFVLSRTNLYMAKTERFVDMFDTLPVIMKYKITAINTGPTKCKFTIKSYKITIK